MITRRPGYNKNIEYHLKLYIKVYKDVSDKKIQNGNIFF